MSSLFLRQPLGLGDHICCNGLTRTLAAENPERDIVLPVRRDYVPSVQWMYSDLGNVSIIPVDGNKEADARYNNWKQDGDTALCISARGQDLLSFAETFYKVAGVPPENRWSKFHVPPRPTWGKTIFDRLAGKHRPYAFLHDDPARTIGVDWAKLSPGHAMISPHPGLTDVIFDYVKLIEEASAVHCISSSFAHWIDCAFPHKKGSMFLHRYVRKDGTDCVWRNMTVVD